MTLILWHRSSTREARPGASLRGITQFQDATSACAARSQLQQKPPFRARLIAIIIFVATTFYILLSGSWPANLVANRVAVPNGRVEKVDGNFVSGRVRLARVSERTWYLNLPALTPFAGHDYATNFPFTENPISAGGIWVGGGTAGNGCNGRPWQFSLVLRTPLRDLQLPSSTALEQLCS